MLKPEERMRVLVISATFPPMRSGGADYAFRFCQELTEAGMEVCVVTSQIEGVATDPRMQIRPLMRRWSWLEMPRLLRIIRSFKPDVLNLHFNGYIYNNHPMITFIPAASKWLIPGLRVVTHIEAPGGAQPHLLSRLTRAVRKIASIWVGSGEADYYYGTILRDSDHLIVLSDTHRPLLSRYFAGINKKCSFIPPPPIMPIALEANGSTRTRGRELLGVSPDEFLFAYFGYIYVEKGLDPLLEAFHHVVKQRENVRLVIIGGSNEFGLKWARRPHYVEELKALTERLGIKNKVLWTGYYPTDSNIGSTYLRAADACVLPFDNGVYMNNSSFAAAAAHGLPIITTRGEILESPFVDRHNVLLCPPQDPQSLATAIDSLISDPNLRRQLRFGALELAGEWFSWDKAMQRTVEIFKRGK